MTETLRATIQEKDKWTTAEVKDPAEALQKALATGQQSFRVYAAAEGQAGFSDYGVPGKDLYCYVGFDRVYTRQDLKEDVMREWQMLKEEACAKAQDARERTALQEAFDTSSLPQQVFARVDGQRVDTFITGFRNGAYQDLGGFWPVAPYHKVFDKTGKPVYPAPSL